MLVVKLDTFIHINFDIEAVFYIYIYMQTSSRVCLRALHHPPSRAQLAGSSVMVTGIIVAANTNTNELSKREGELAVVTIGKLTVVLSLSVVTLM
jgi:hypothetical protein